MKPPNARQAIVEREKVVDYLLNPAHPDNGGKADFLHGLGFNRLKWWTLAEALRKLAEEGEVTKSIESVHGRKYIVDGGLGTPGVTVRTVWIVEPDAEVPRLVTAYPSRAGKEE